MATVNVLVANLRANSRLGPNGLPMYRRVDGDLVLQFTHTDGICMLSVRERAGAAGEPLSSVPVRLQAILTGLGCPSTSLAYMGESPARTHYWAWLDAAGSVALLSEARATGLRDVVRRVKVVGQHPTLVGSA